MVGPARSLLLETSHRLGHVAVARDAKILGECRLDESRRHARDLAPAIKELLAEQGWQARDLEAVIVSRGPGSYTGLRVGLMSAKVLAYATGCALLAIDTFAALAEQAPTSALTVDVIADAQQDKVYVQRFARTSAADAWQSRAPLTIIPCDEWAANLPDGLCVIGPGLEPFASRLPANAILAEREAWFPRPASLLRVALARWQRGERDDPFAVEPQYLRASSAEEKWKQLGR